MPATLNSKRVACKVISDAHRWARKQRLFGCKKPRVDGLALLEALEQSLWLPEPEGYTRVVLDDPGTDAVSVCGIPFPDGSLVWYEPDSDLWGVTDPDRIDASHQFVITDE